MQNLSLRVEVQFLHLAASFPPTYQSSSGVQARTAKQTESEVTEDRTAPDDDEAMEE
jgi:hypothetical protein